MGRSAHAKPCCIFGCAWFFLLAHTPAVIDANSGKDALKEKKMESIAQTHEKTVLLVVDCCCTSEYGDKPSYAIIGVTRSMIDRIIKLTALCDEHKLSSVCDFGGPTEWHQELELRIRDDRMEIHNQGMYYSASPKHCDYQVETQWISIEELESIFANNEDGAFVHQCDESASERFLEDRSDQIKEACIESGRDSTAMDLALARLKKECGALFEDDESALEFLSEDSLAERLLFTEPA